MVQIADFAPAQTETEPESHTETESQVESQTESQTAPQTKASATELFWVLDGERRREIHDYKEYQYQPKDRPKHLRCPACLTPVYLHMGNKVRWHAAHNVETDCVLASPETRCHYYTKYALAAYLEELMHTNQALAARGPLPCLHPRSEPRDPTTGRPAPWTRPIIWDVVEVETSVGDLRPDILLRNAGKPVLAVEVVQTNGVTDTKRAKFSQLELPWLSIQAARHLVNLPGWRTQGMLHVADAGGGSPWACEACDAARALSRARHPLQSTRPRAPCPQPAPLPLPLFSTRRPAPSADRLLAYRWSGLHLGKIWVFDIYRPGTEAIRQVEFIGDAFTEGEWAYSLFGRFRTKHPHSIDHVRRPPAGAPPTTTDIAQVHQEFRTISETHHQARRQRGQQIDVRVRGYSFEALMESALLFEQFASVHARPPAPTAHAGDDPNSLLRHPNRGLPHLFDLLRWLVEDHWTLNPLPRIRTGTGEWVRDPTDPTPEPDLIDELFDSETVPPIMRSMDIDQAAESLTEEPDPKPLLTPVPPTDKLASSGDPLIPRVSSGSHSTPPPP